MVASDITCCSNSEVSCPLSTHPIDSYMYPSDGLKLGIVVTDSGICRLSCAHRRLRGMF